MFAQAFESVKRRYFGGGPRARPGPDGAQRPETTSTTGNDDSLRLTPDEEILELVEGRGGRIEQGEVVDALSWSPATVSRRLGELESDGRVVRYPVGRRKIVCLPGCEPAATRPPFEA